MSDKDRKLLIGILEFAQKVKRRTSLLSFNDFLKDDDMQDAVLYALGQMGEKTNQLSDEFKEKYPKNEWYGLIGLRNRIFHSYKDISMDIVYNVSYENIDSLIELLEDLLN